MGWNKGLTKETSELVLKYSKSLKNGFESGRLKNPIKGKTLSEETKEKIRNSQINNLLNKYEKRFPRYNDKSIPVLDDISKEMGWNLQHAENGGEFRTELGFFVDAYDKEKNIVVEYDERKHYKDVKNNILTDKDKKRQDAIIKLLKCDFYRFNEVTGILWKANK